MTEYFVQAFIYLSAAVIAVPLFKRLGLGSVLGYLVAGVVIGPVTGLVGQETVTIQHFAEFGVVMMLFLVGLELEPTQLWSMRHKLLGLGGLQVLITVLAVFGIALTMGMVWSVALAIGMIFALSSTAIVLQTLNEKGLSKTEGGRSSISILLFQDIAVIPIIAFLPLLALPELMDAAGAAHGDGHGDHGYNLKDQLSPLVYAGVVVLSIAGLIAGGRYLIPLLFRYVAGSRLREVFTASALMLVIGIAALMSLIGLSPALGAFLAGVVLASSEYRHELEADIEPFKGLLLGLFFITVGAGINFSVLAQSVVLIVGGTIALMLLKMAILVVLARLFRIESEDQWLMTLSLAQAGEFGFVLISYSLQNSVLPKDVAEILSLIVALSMFLTPILFIIYEHLVLPRYNQSETGDAEPIEAEGKVIIAGIGRFGQIVNRLLIANNVSTTVLDNQVSQIEMMRGMGVKSYFGDASQPALLHTAGIEDADLFIAAFDDKARTSDVVRHVKAHHPNVKIVARAFDRGHSYELRELGADFVIKETYLAALEAGRESLNALGVHPFRANQIKSSFLRNEKKYDEALYKSWLESEESHAFTSHYRELFYELEEAIKQSMAGDREDAHSSSQRSWTPPPKKYIDDFEQADE